MHAVYTFLVRTADFVCSAEEEEETLWNCWGAEVEGFLNEYGDENNWYTLMYGVRTDNKVHVYTPEGTPHFTCETQRFDELLNFSLSCIAAEIRLRRIPLVNIPGKAPAAEAQALRLLGYPEFCDELFRTMCGVLSWELSQLSLETWKEYCGKDAFSMEQREGRMRPYDLQHMLHVATYFMSSVIAPFTTRKGTPYDYRCFDLRRDCSSTSLDQCAIIAVDVHT